MAQANDYSLSREVTNHLFQGLLILVDNNTNKNKSFNTLNFQSLEKVMDSTLPRSTSKEAESLGRPPITGAAITFKHSGRELASFGHI